MSDAMIRGDETSVDTLREALFGRSVVSVRMYDGDAPAIPDEWGYGSDYAQGEVRLDDGTVLYLAGHRGGCSCGAGDYDLTRLNDMPINGITNVEVRVEEKPDRGEWSEEQTYRVFVLAQGMGPVELAAFEGDDGNGYYGTGFWFSIAAPSG